MIMAPPSSNRLPISALARIFSNTTATYNFISKVENTFNGRSSNEIIIDPIAIYREF